MNKPTTIDKLVNELKSIEHIANKLKKTDAPPQLDLDYMLEKTRRVYEHILSLQGDAGKVPEKTKEMPVKQEEEQKPPPQTEAQKPGPGETESPRELEKKAETKAPAPQEENNEDLRKEQAEAAPQAKTETQPKQESPKEEEPEKAEEKPTQSGRTIVADKYENDKENSVADHFLSAFGASTLGEELGKGKISNIKAGLGINDRYTFIQELFKGNSEHFGRAVNELNELGSFKEALSYIDQNFDWSTDNPFAVDFVKLVKRRFL